MLTRLRFKNWRSLKDVTIEGLTPLTVFIGANSSGKTNIIDGLAFMRDLVNFRVQEAVRGNRRNKARTLGTTDEDLLVFQAELSGLSGTHDY